MKKLIEWSLGVALLVAIGVAQAISIETTITPLDQVADSANLSHTSSPIFTDGDVIYVAFVRKDPSNSAVYQTVVGKYENAQWAYSIIEASTLKDAYHAQPSLVMDADGYIHVVYNMHSSPWQYSVSKNPRDITEWEFRGQELKGPHNDPTSSYVSGPGTADIPGNRITYPHMIVDTEGVPYVVYREALYTTPGTDYFEAQHSLGISRYDLQTKKWKRVGHNCNDLPFATEPGYRAQAGRLHFDRKNRLHVSYMYYKEYEKDGSGHKKPNYPVYAVSDDGGYTFKKADGTPLNLPVALSASDRVLNPNWLTKTTNGYFYAYTKVASMPDGSPWVWVMPKGQDRKFVPFNDGWQAPVNVPWGAMDFVIDNKGVITALSSHLRVHRSYDKGKTWRTWLLDCNASIFWIDERYTRDTGNLRFLGQTKVGGQLRVYTVKFSDTEMAP